ELGGWRLGMNFGIGCDRHVEVGDALQAGDEIRGVSKSIWMRPITRLPLRRIAAQCDHIADAFVPVAACDFEDLGLGCADAGQMRGTDQRRFPLYARDEIVRTLTG